MGPIASILSGLIYLVELVVIVWCLLTWFPNIRWYDQPFRTLDKIVTPILAPCKKLIPPIGNFDLSAMVTIILLQVLQHAVMALPF
jgi:YggT family protein